jgi:hypothetical protein
MRNIYRPESPSPSKKPKKLQDPKSLLTAEDLYAKAVLDLFVQMDHLEGRNIGMPLITVQEMS